MAESPGAAGPARGAAPVHLAHVEGLRAIAAYVVFVNHAYAQVWDPVFGRYPPRWLSPFTYFLVAGHLAVTVFIVLSGFCLMLPVARAGNELRGGTLAFFRRRARRILPPYYGAVAFCLLCIWTFLGTPTGTLWDVPIQVKGSTVALVSHLLLLQDLFGGGKINYVFWSVAVEWHIYFLFPLLVWSWRRYGARFTVMASVVAGYALRAAFHETRIVRAMPHYVGMFAFGMLAAAIVQSTDPRIVRLRDRVAWGWIGAGAIAAAAILTGVWGWERTTERFYVVDFPVGIFTAALLVLTSRDLRGRAARALAWRPLVVVGTFSYSVYLMHAPIIQIVWQFLLAPAGLTPVETFFALMGPGLVAALAASYAFFRVCEEPFMRRSSARGMARSIDLSRAAHDPLPAPSEVSADKAKA